MTLKQVWREGDRAIYEYHGGFEVIHIKTAPAQTIYGRDYPEREVYPTDNDWGTYAITRPASDELGYLRERAFALP